MLQAKKWILENDTMPVKYNIHVAIIKPYAILLRSGELPYDIKLDVVYPNPLSDYGSGRYV